MVNLWHAIRQTERIAELEAERDYLDARLADFERLAKEFVNFDMPDCVCRARFIKLMESEE